MTRDDQSLEITCESPDSWWRATRSICPDPARIAADSSAVPRQSEKAVWLVAKRRGRVVGTCRGEPAAGSAAAVFPPTLAERETRVTGRILLETAADDFLQKDAALVYALLGPEAAEQEELFVGSGFQRLGPVWHMAAPASNQANCHGELQFESVVERGGSFERLASTFGQTCHQTLDFPELHRWLTAQQSLAGYRDVGHFRPELWQIVKQHRNDVGCLLLNELDGPLTTQLTYVGLVPSVRGRGLSREVVEYGRQLAFRFGARQITLAVDPRNVPAVHCYQAAGFVEIDRQTLWVKPTQGSSRK